MKKAISILVSFIIVLTSIVGFSSTAFAKTIEGECGDNASFVYDYDTKTLTISGTGAIGDYIVRLVHGTMMKKMMLHTM